MRIAITTVIFIFAFLTGLHAQSVCSGDSVTLTGPGSGTWSSSNTAVATVGLTSGTVTGVAAGTVTITYSLMSSFTTTAFTVNPSPTLSSAHTLPTICDSAMFNYTPVSTVAGTAFTWYRPYIPGIATISGSGTGSISEQLINTTNVPVTVTYIYGMSAPGGCTDSQLVTVIVNPSPMLSSTLSPPSLCDTFIYDPSSVVFGTTYQWQRPAVTGITPATNFGTGNIFEVLHNTTTSAITVHYEYRLGVGSCLNINYQTVSVVVEPCALGANRIINDAEGIKIYPNPSNGLFTIEMPKNGSNATITITDVLGKVVERRNTSKGSDIKESFNLEYLPPGTYLVKTEVNGHTSRDKVVIW